MATISRVNGIHLWSATGGTIWMDGLSFSNSLTVEQNVLGPGVIGHILRNRVIDEDTYALTDSWFHYDQVGSVMLASNSAGTKDSVIYQDAWGNVLSGWDTGHWASDQSGWHHNTKATDGDLGLVYMYQRWYSPQTSTFFSRAPYPVEEEHSYRFTILSPTAETDVLGMQADGCKCEQARERADAMDNGAAFAQSCAKRCQTACSTNAASGSEGEYFFNCYNSCLKDHDCVDALIEFNLCIYGCIGRPRCMKKCKKHIEGCE